MVGRREGSDVAAPSHGGFETVAATAAFDPVLPVGQREGDTVVLAICGTDPRCGGDPDRIRPALQFQSPDRSGGTPGNQDSRDSVGVSDDPGDEDSVETGPDAERVGGLRGSVILAALMAAMRSDSLLLKTYGVVGPLLAVIVSVLVALAFPVWVEGSLGQSQLITFSRGFLLISGLLLVVALLSPLLYAYRRRRSGDRSRRSDFFLAAAGYGLVGSLYLSLLVSAPPEQRGTPPTIVAPLVEGMYGLDPMFAVVPPLLAVVLIVIAGNR